MTRRRQVVAAPELREVLRQTRGAQTSLSRARVRCFEPLENARMLLMLRQLARLERELCRVVAVAVRRRRAA